MRGICKKAEIRCWDELQADLKTESKERRSGGGEEEEEENIEEEDEEGDLGWFICCSHIMGLK